MFKPIITGYRTRYNATRMYLLGVGLFVCLSGITFPGMLRQTSFARALASYTISGTVFDDYNQNGVQDARELGVNGVMVSATSRGNTVVATATSGTASSVLGTYTLTIPEGTGPVRVHFSNFGANSTIPQLIGFQPSKHTGGTTIAFVDGTEPTNTLNLGIERPSEYCQNNPNLATSCYVQGDQTNGAAHVVVRFPSSGGTTNTQPPTPLAAASDVGSTWGLAYRRSSDDLFASAYTKQFAGYKPGGSAGSIYLIHGANSATPTVSSTPFIDLAALFGAHIAGINPHNARNNYKSDLSAYDAVGKTALGGIALSEDESTLYAMNLADRNLYSIPIGAPPANPVAPGATAITHIALPTPNTCDVEDMRPFAVTSYNNSIYVGAICSAETTITPFAPSGDRSKLRAYVFAYTPSAGFKQVFETSLDYPRHCADEAFRDADGCARHYSAAWNPWQPDFSKAYPRTVYPQPMLTGIAFDNGDMILGLRDRYGDQTAHALGGVPEARTAGDTLRACLNQGGDLSSGWTLENNASCGQNTTSGKNNGKGPSKGQYYYQQYFFPAHDHVSMGGVAQIPGATDVISTVYDPGKTIFTAGTRTYNNKTGEETSNYEVYNTYKMATTFGKSNGLGGLVALCQSAPIEIGDRIWLDSNGNGIQDAGEPSIVGATVHLYTADGKKLLQTTISDANGNYYFPISPYTGYVVRLDNSSDYATGPLKGLQLTLANQDNGQQGIDSQAIVPDPTSPVGAGNFPQVTIHAHTPGQNDYGQDIGFLNAPDLAITKVHQGSATKQIGQNVTYTLTIKNEDAAGPVLAKQSITVVDGLPSGISNVQATATDWHIVIIPANQTITATYTGSYPVAAAEILPPITITGTLTSAAEAQLINVATVTTPADTNESNNTAFDTIQVQRPQPAATTSVTLTMRHEGKGCFPAGQQVSYQLAVHNPQIAYAVAATHPITILDALSARISHITARGNNWRVTIAKLGDATLVTAIYTGSRIIAPGASLPPLTVTATLDKGMRRSLMSAATVEIAGNNITRDNVITDSVRICPHKIPTRHPALPPTGNGPLMKS